MVRQRQKQKPRQAKSAAETSKKCGGLPMYLAGLVACSLLWLAVQHSTLHDQSNSDEPGATIPDISRFLHSDVVNQKEAKPVNLRGGEDINDDSNEIAQSEGDDEDDSNQDAKEMKAIHADAPGRAESQETTESEASSDEDSNAKPETADTPTDPPVSDSQVDQAGEDAVPEVETAVIPRSAEGLKIYVHKLSGKFDHEEMIKHYPKCRGFQWANDFRLARFLLKSKVLTTNIHEADFFYVPFLAKCWFNFGAKYRLDRMDNDVKELLRELDKNEAWRKYPEKHLFAFVSGAGPTLFRSWSSIRSSGFILAEGDTALGIYNSARDVVIPGVSVVKPNKERDPHRKRKLLATFRGNLISVVRDEDGKEVFRRSLLRLALVALAKDRSDLVVGDRIYEEADRHTYLKDLESATFCIIPRGITPWTRRLFDAMLSDCIPVVVSNAIVFPYERSIDYTKFTLKLPEAWVEQLFEILAKVSPSQVLELQRNVREMASRFSKEKGKNPMEAILEELAIVRHLSSGGGDVKSATDNGLKKFWMPGRGVFELTGNEALQVGPSYGAGAVPHPEELWEPDAAFKSLVGGTLDLAADPPWWWLKYKAPKDFKSKKKSKSKDGKRKK